jgi:spore coat polysaccharide biosynthesis protein SpsF
MVNNPYIIVQARMNSERLPGKVMMKIGGKPLIEILINRLKQSEIPILLATSTNPENNCLVDFVENLGVKTFRGSENNVLERYYQAAMSVDADLIIRATGDNPLMDGSILKDAYSYYLAHEENRLFLSIGLSETFPLGISASLFSFDLLEEAYNKATLPGELEHVTPYLINNIPGNITVRPFSGGMKKYDYRLTVDTTEDFKLHKILIEKYSCDKMSIYKIIEVLDNNPEVANLNTQVRQKKWNE